MRDKFTLPVERSERSAACTRCGANVPGGTEGCRRLFHEVLALEYGDAAHGAVHLLTVDAYALQHSEDQRAFYRECGGSLPIEATAREVCLFEKRDGVWHKRAAYALADSSGEWSSPDRAAQLILWRPCTVWNRREYDEATCQL